MSSRQLSITPIGGSTALLEFGGQGFSPTRHSTPLEANTGWEPATLRKLSDPALSPDAVGVFDYVLLSHDHHFDNLDHAGRAQLKNAKAVLTTQGGRQTPW